MRSVLLSIGAVWFSVGTGDVLAADCTVLPTNEPLSLSGQLEHRTFSGATAEGSSFSESAYLLKLDRSRCFVGAQFVDGEVEVKIIQLIVSGDDDRGLYGRLKALTGNDVTVTGKNAAGTDAKNRPRHALVSMLVSSISSSRTGDLQSAIEGEDNAMPSDDGTEGETPDMEPSRQTTDPTSRETGDGGMGTVEGFYLALAHGDGSEAAQHIIPAKRRAGPLSARAMTSFYSALKRPLRLLDVRPLGDGRYRASYTFETRQGRRCDGNSVVTTVAIGGANLISRIVAENGC